TEAGAPRGDHGPLDRVVRRAEHPASCTTSSGPEAIHRVHDVVGGELTSVGRRFRVPPQCANPRMVVTTAVANQRGATSTSYSSDMRSSTTGRGYDTSGR